MNIESWKIRERCHCGAEFEATAHGASVPDEPLALVERWRGEHHCAAAETLLPAEISDVREALREMAAPGSLLICSRCSNTYHAALGGSFSRCPACDEPAVAS